MDRFCPNCNSEMTPSLVGYLCVNCGHVQRFYSNADAALAEPAHLVGASAPEPVQMTQTETQNDSTKPTNKVKATLKRLMVPELPDPLHHQTLSLAEPTPTQIPAPNPQPPTPTALDLGIAPELPTPDPSSPTQASLSELQAALHTKQDTSVWVLVSLAVLLLVFAGVLLAFLFLR